MDVRVKAFAFCTLLASMLLAAPAHALTKSHSFDKHSFDKPTDGDPAVTDAARSLSRHSNDSGHYPLDQNSFQGPPDSTKSSNLHGDASEGDFNFSIHTENDKPDTYDLHEFRGLGGDNDEFEGAYGVSPVPEPYSLALLFAGLGLLGLRLRRR